ncbi:MAG: hypothetical protein F2571_01985 [Actinobacteria bacterium]|uniref:Unannotated protein n=1 Tax=freshwater metagenome TaxID=449393 RepID=A0A6J6FJ73_9ZZZZ|nr:hypothetical protein [Actinomycetota bacterium]
MKIRTWFKKTPIGRLVWRVIIGAIGGLITVFGAIALVGPGPGILILLAGLGILATEFAWAARVMVHTRTYAQKAADKVGIPKWAQLALVAIGAVVSILVILFLHSAGKI